MMFLSKCFSFFPLFEAVLIVSCLIHLIRHPSIMNLFLLTFIIYGFPVLVFRVTRLFIPLTKEGISRLDIKEISPWWIGHQIQLIYIAIPQIEALIRLIPGAFSIWLRLWGSKIGHGVYWTPLVEIIDRSLMEVGKNVVFGHRVFCSSHLIKRKFDRITLFVKKIRIGANVFIGAGSNLGPGVNIEADAFVPAKTDLYLNNIFNVEDSHELQRAS